MLKYMSEAAVLGSLAAREALEEAKVRNRFSPERLGLYSGIGLAAANFGEVQRMIEESVDANGSFSCHLFGKRGLAATNPLMSFKILANIPACLISIMEQIKGPNLILTPWEGQTGAALLEAWRAVTSGEVDCALAGAADSAAYPAALVYLQKTGLLREGEYPASSAAYFVLERFETAETDRKRFYAHVESIEITNSGKETSDPLSARMGRTFAAAPALLLGIGCMDGWRKLSICGVDRQRIEMNLKVSL
jgi:3-oxoacyl-(acyl-carrier-protein) synthase